VLLQATGLALLASLSPTALLIVAVYLGSERPKVTAAFYLAGALFMSLATGVVTLLALRSADLDRAADRAPRYGFRLGLGIVLLAIGVVLARRKQPSAKEAGEQQGFVFRMATRPGTASAFAVGVLVFAPGVTFLAALQVIATASVGIDLTIVAVIIVVVTNALLVWLPIGLYLVFPVKTTRYLAIFNGWLRAHGRILLVCVMFVLGAIMVSNGVYGLVAVR
jgi:Sap, sulfolipid-1-addressing protein